MSEININPRYLAMLTELLDLVVPDAEVWAFGSRVDGSCHEGSDLDIVIRNTCDLSVPIGSRLSVLREKLANSNIPILVDVLDWALIPESFGKEILCGYVVVCQKKSNTADIG